MARRQRFSRNLGDPVISVENLFGDTVENSRRSSIDSGLKRAKKESLTVPITENNKAIGMSGWKSEYCIVPVKQGNHSEGPCGGKAVPD